MKKPGFLKRNGLSIVFLTLAIISIYGQSNMGWKEHNEILRSFGRVSIPYSEYLKSGHFIQATFENWESEFLQMALFVILTIFLRQQGSSESKPCDEPIIDQSELEAKSDSPWAVKKKGIALAIYKHSLSIALLILFIISFLLHWYGSWEDYNESQALENKPLINMTAYLGYDKFWFESFQNWQSEFMSIFAIIYLSIYLRQMGSPQSKPVNASHEHTGE